MKKSGHAKVHSAGRDRERDGEFFKVQASFSVGLAGQQYPSINWSFLPA
jgi:hypothetical protein